MRAIIKNRKEGIGYQIPNENEIRCNADYTLYILGINFMSDIDMYKKDKEVNRSHGIDAAMLLKDLHCFCFTGDFKFVDDPIIKLNDL